MKKDNPKSKSFQTVWKIKAGDLIMFETEGSFTIDWGDGTVEQVMHGEDQYKLNGFNELNHRYVNKGKYTVNITEGITSFSLLSSRDVVCEQTASRLIDIKQWGAAQWESMNCMLYNACNMVCSAKDIPDLSKVKNMNSTFYNCHKFNSPIEHWDFSAVEEMFCMLSCARSFNQPLTKMDLGAVQDVFCMLRNTPAFKQDLRDLNIGAKVDTNDLMGANKSLAAYNEKYGSQVDKQKMQDVLIEQMRVQ